ncbi:hypothetical protein D6C97_03449 [Aureobasidium pullulans]|nr:hypothetical protein D6C97_03449 [Aureobasidium pullulans]
MDSLKSSFFGRLFTDNRIKAETAGEVTQPTITPSVTAVGPITVFVPMATTNQPTPGLLKCPNEVLANIFSNPGLSKNDIKALRLVCTQLRPLATRVFAQRYFTDPFVILSRYSLEALVQICKDSIFSPHVQSIGFLTSTLCPHGISERASRLQKAILEGNQESTTQELLTLNAFTEFCEEQVHLECSGEAEKLLASAISALARPITVTVTNDITSINPIGVSKVPSDRYYNSSYTQKSPRRAYSREDGYSEVRSRMKHLLRLVPNAIYQMDLGDRKHFEGLKIQIRKDTYMSHHDDCLGGLHMSQGIYRCLKSLHLEMSCYALRDKRSIAGLKDLFEVVPDLQKLTFVTDWVRGTTIAKLFVTNMTRWLDTPSAFSLRVMALEEVVCTSESLLGVMERHKKTLKEVKLSGVTLLGSWTKCISWMMENLHLENFCIENASNISHARKTNNSRFIPADCLVEPTNLVGEEDTRVGLEQLLKHKFEK